MASGVQIPEALNFRLTGADSYEPETRQQTQQRETVDSRCQAHEGREHAAESDSRRIPPLNIMACTRPLTMYRAGDGAVFFSRKKAGTKETGVIYAGKKAIVLKERATEMEVPCGHCMACRIQYTREWTARVMAETMDQKHSHFVTLTYKPELQPYGLMPDDLTKFLDRLRYYHGRFRYYAVGEYGEKHKKPHFHLCYWPENPIQFGEKVGRGLWNSTTIAKAWDLGFNSVSHRLETAAAGYVVGYVRKKLGSAQYITDDGEILQPPFARMSLGRGKDNGIGMPYVLRNQTAIAKNGGIILGGKKLPISKDLVKRMTAENQSLIETTRYARRRTHTQKNLDDMEINLQAQKRNTKL